MKKRAFSILTAVLLLCAFTGIASASAPAYQNDFNSGSLKTTEWKTWNLDPNSNGAWDIADVGGDKWLRGQIAKFNDAIAHYKAKKFKDVTVEADVILERGNALGIIIRMDDSAQGYQIIFDQYDGIKLCRRPYYVFKSGGTIDVGTKYHIQFSAIGDKIKAVITNTATNEDLTLEVTDSTYTSSGYVAFNVFGFHHDGTSNAVGLFDNLKIYSGAVAATSSSAASSAPETGSRADGTSQGTQSKAPVNSQPDGEESQAPSGESQPGEENSKSDSADFNLLSLYSDVTIDNAAKKVFLERELNVSELKDSFSVPDGYTLKVVDSDGNEISDNQRTVTGDMKLVFSRDLSEYVYTLTLTYGGEGAGGDSFGAAGVYVWIIVSAAVVLAGAGVGLFFALRKKNAPGK